MKVFFFYAGTPTPVFETELELIRHHERLGHRVRVLQCAGELPNCHWNREHDGAQCAACRSKFSNGWKVLKPAANVELKQFPPHRFDRDDLPPLFNSVDDLRKYQYDGENLGFGVLSGLISIFRDHRFDTRRHRQDVLRELRTAVHVYRTLKREFEEFRPDCVYFFNGRIATQLPALLLCRRMGIEYFTYEVAVGNDSYLLLRNRTVHEPISAEQLQQWRSDWTPERRQHGESLVRQRRLGKNLTKVPVFTAQQVKGLLPADFDARKRNIAIYNGTIDEYAGVEGWENRIYRPDETAGVQAILQAFEADDDFMFYLRVHPHMKELPSGTSQLVDIRALGARFRNLRILWPADTVDSYALMNACEKVVTFGSTIGMEATYWGKPSILAGRAFYENLDCVYVPATHDELVHLIRARLGPKPADAVLMYFHWDATNGIPFSYFRETGVKNGLATGTFDGVEIRPEAPLAFAKEVSRFVRGAWKAAMKPSQAWLMLKRYAKTF